MKKSLFLAIALSLSFAAQAKDRLEFNTSTSKEYKVAYGHALRIETAGFLLVRLTWNVAAAELYCSFDVAKTTADMAGQVAGALKTLSQESYDAMTTDKTIVDAHLLTRQSFSFHEEGSHRGMKNSCKRNVEEIRLIGNEVASRIDALNP
ncbi:MAG: hypothetical protein V4596_04965 [Bdellovibrionota bacterium]